VYKKRWESFGWKAYSIDGHNLKALIDTFEKVMIIII
jgi:transketolase N-terminal domain/subunit